MKRLTMQATVVVAGLSVLTGCAMFKKKMSTTDAIAARQQLMKEQGAAMRAIGEKVKAGQAQAAAADAEKLTETAKRIPDLFPKDSLDPKTSRAKPEIWQKWSEFEGYAKKLETQAKSLSATARSGDAAATGAAAGALGKETCGACHNAFRGPEIKK